MKKLFTIVFLVAFSSLGWWAGNFIGTGTAFLLSIVGGVVGVVIAWKLNQLAGG